MTGSSDFINQMGKDLIACLLADRRNLVVIGLNGGLDEQRNAPTGWEVGEKRPWGNTAFRCCSPSGRLGH